ncbi:MAG: hypothetical protein IT558_05550 [Alphaproteobacteria bacterium]|nr:hypothetical protein [Alphaproteobacteria bacterium]
MFKTMFDDLFNFGKKRTLTESIGFFMFHSGVILVVFGVLSALGIA